jgi:hypothetical protein
MIYVTEDPVANVDIRSLVKREKSFKRYQMTDQLSFFYFQSNLEDN